MATHTCRGPTGIAFVGSYAHHPPVQTSTQACDSPSTTSPSFPSGFVCRYPDTYRAGTPIARSITSVTCAKSWQPPSRACHASVAVEWTPVVPGWYFRCLFFFLLFVCFVLVG